MDPSMNSVNEYTFVNMQQNEQDSENLQEKYNLDNYFQTSLPYHLQPSSEWMLNSSSPSPSNTPTTPSPHLSNASLSNTSNGFPSHWPTGPTSSSEATQSIKEIQRLTDAKSRRRQQNRESQRAFRERKNRHIEHLEQALADLQHRHEKLLQCFVGLTARVSGDGMQNAGAANRVMTAGMGSGISEMSFLDESSPTTQFGYQSM